MPVPQEKMFFVERAGEPVLAIFAILSTNESSAVSARTLVLVEMHPISFAKTY